ncbi:MAG: cell division protein SepF [Candidatus Micrarchaeota archaeon]|nr:cell division protein SepF [Candidatus Micrarchaeota archaeon]
MVLRAIFGKDTRTELEEGDYIELDTDAVETGGGRIPIKIERLEDFSDSDRIQKAVRDGAIVLVKIKTLKDKDISELKRVIDKLRKTCIAINGDIAGIDEDWICLTPSFAHIARETKEEQ